jgi:hypothetical protein
VPAAVSAPFGLTYRSDVEAAAVAAEAPLHTTAVAATAAAAILNPLVTQS